MRNGNRGKNKEESRWQMDTGKWRLAAQPVKLSMLPVCVCIFQWVNVCFICNLQLVILRLFCRVTDQRCLSLSANSVLTTAESCSTLAEALQQRSIPRGVCCVLCRIEGSKELALAVLPTPGLNPRPTTQETAVIRTGFYTPSSTPNRAVAASLPTAWPWKEALSDKE